MRTFRRDGNGTMDGPYGQVKDAKIARLAAADQSDRDEKRSGNAPVRPVANDKFAGERLNSRRWAGLGHKLVAGRGQHAIYHLAGFADTSKSAEDWGISRICREILAL